MIGSITIDKYALGPVLSLPLLEHVTKTILVVAGEGLNTVSMPRLREVGEKFMMFGFSIKKFEAPLLEEVCTHSDNAFGWPQALYPCDMMVAATSLTELELPSLRAVNTRAVGVNKYSNAVLRLGPANYLLRRVLMPKLASVGKQLWVSSNPKLDCITTADNFDTYQVVMFGSYLPKGEGGAMQPWVQPNGCFLSQVSPEKEQGCFFGKKNNTDPSMPVCVQGTVGLCPSVGEQEVLEEECPPGCKKSCPSYPPKLSEEEKRRIMYAADPIASMAQKIKNKRALLFMSNPDDERCPGDCVPANEDKDLESNPALKPFLEASGLI